MASDTSASEPGAGAAGTRRRAISWVKRAVALAAVVPAARIAWLAAEGQLGANPIAEAMNRLGFWTLTLLLASLAATPLRIVSGWSWPIALRKLLGLAAFTYACLHFSVYLGLDQLFDLGDIGRDVVKRKFITVGFAALLLLVPLAVTSTAGMLKRLGARRWKRLHRLVYPAAVLGVIHFLWRVKSDRRQPLIFAAVLAVLLAVRLVAFLAARARRGRAGLGPRPGAAPARSS